MEKKKTQITDQFYACDSKGTRYEVIEYTEITYVKTHDGKLMPTLPDKIFFRLADGSRVDPVRAGEYDAYLEDGAPTPVRLVRA